MNRLKCKVAVASLMISTLYTMSTAYAYSDAGNVLQNWYQAQLHDSISSAKGILIRQQSNHSVKELKDAIQDMISRTNGKLKKVEFEAGMQVIGSIQTVNASYQAQIEQASKQLKIQSAKNQFERYVKETSEQFDIELDQTVDKSIKEMTSSMVQ
ncbi:hypothetical protein [Paenibacillus hexagrammi]|uniref:Uncharacterized protein n=1 Tax=Paenibacillus hexagrammi TaxID=2908839 RepID=A0ABY3SHL3_9BACL|nr:hypothetical protein [Paenibacillus sp. YPD9-1]UJF32990.1 hypothetical protein L0M14_26005 [Paenibacillus sp. YPD9-1]